MQDLFVEETPIKRNLCKYSNIDGVLWKLLIDLRESHIHVYSEREKISKHFSTYKQEVCLGLAKS